MWPIPQFPADLVKLTEEILSENLHFLYSMIWFLEISTLSNIWDGGVLWKSLAIFFFLSYSYVKPFIIHGDREEYQK